jgi:hypothetical protein
MSQKYRHFLRSKTCGWCAKPYSDTLDQHLKTCPVRKAVGEAEVRAGRELTFEETRAVRDRARASS